MLTFLPALILLLLHGPANMEGPLARAGERADVGSRLPNLAPAAVRSNREFLAALLRRFPGATVLAAFADEQAEVGDAPALLPGPIAPRPTPVRSSPTPTSQRDRDGPLPA